MPTLLQRPPVPARQVWKGQHRPLGATWTGDGVNFALFSQHATGVVLCLLSVVYVFALKNNRPEHYDTDFFESALIESGLLELAFGPRLRRIANPFSETVADEEPTMRTAASARKEAASERRRGSTGAQPAAFGAAQDSSARVERVSKPTRGDEEKTVPLSAYEKVKAELSHTEEQLEEALFANQED